MSFCCNDYLNLTHHPAIKAAAIAALARYGVGAGASRLVTGNHPLFAELEGRLATDWTNMDVLTGHRAARDELTELLEKWEVLFSEAESR